MPKNGKIVSALQKSQKSLKFETPERVVQKIFEMAMIPVRAALTVALLPVVDKNIISKIYGTQDDNKRGYIPAQLYFQGVDKNSDTFKKLMEGKKQ